MHGAPCGFSRSIIFLLIVTLTLAPRMRFFSVLIQYSLRERISYFIYLQNWPVFWASWAGMSGLWGAFWSLAVEEQFYLVWPTLLHFVSVRKMLILCVVGFLLGLPERAFLIHQVGLKLGTIQWPFSRLHGLFLGAAIALYRNRFGRVVPASWGVASFSIGAILFLLIAIFRLPEFDGSGPVIWTVGVTAFAFMSAGFIIAVEHRQPVLMRFLSLRPLTLAGRYSYGMYIYHLVIYFFLRAFWFRYLEAGVGYHAVTSSLMMVFAILLTTGVAAVSFHIFEQPFLNLKRYFPSPSAPV